jgi:peptidoglycan/LPS O-acetylase OafA/YrhL
LVLLALACVPLVPATDDLLEYGTEGWLWAFFGLAHRLALTQGDERMLWTRNSIGAITLVAYLTREIGDYGFDVVQAIVFVILIVALGFCLVAFRREPLRVQPPRPIADVLRIGGRFSLEIYAISLFAMHLLAYAITTQDGAS